MLNIEFMQRAIEEAKNSGKDIPVGAVIVKGGEIIAVAHNKKEVTNQVCDHAEMIAIKKACEKLDNWRLEDCDLYVTLEPCPMCAWAILQSRIKNVYFGSCDTLYGALGSKTDLRNLLNTKTAVKGGILEQECDNILKTYFEKMRNDNKN